MTLGPKAKAIYDQYRKATRMLGRLKEHEQQAVFVLLNGDAIVDSASGRVRYRVEACASAFSHTS